MASRDEKPMVRSAPGSETGQVDEHPACLKDAWCVCGDAAATLSGPPPVLGPHGDANWPSVPWPPWIFLVPAAKYLEPPGVGGHRSRLQGLGNPGMGAGGTFGAGSHSSG